MRFSRMIVCVCILYVLTLPEVLETSPSTANRSSVPSVGEPSTEAARAELGHANAAEGPDDALHYVYEAGTYDKDNWVASWNALAVVVSSAE